MNDWHVNGGGLCGMWSFQLLCRRTFSGHQSTGIYAGQARSAKGLTLLGTSLNWMPWGSGGHMAPASCPSHGVILWTTFNTKFPRVPQRNRVSFISLSHVSTPLEITPTHLTTKPCLRVTPGAPARRGSNKSIENRLACME